MNVVLHSESVQGENSTPDPDPVFSSVRIRIHSRCNPDPGFVVTFKKVEFLDFYFITHSP